MPYSDKAEGECHSWYASTIPMPRSSPVHCLVMPLKGRKIRGGGGSDSSWMG